MVAEYQRKKEDDDGDENEESLLAYSVNDLCTKVEITSDGSQ
ncbi:unnamed protein product [Acanthoscelides obtectus]|uniref:Uncharacterized protein n=1 Tax=Acanthoscelides obtectus TaxID=200917 RepID=A0A9P0KG77_ACAOB|nr:unnamed protein product [Acanthoscelides obtectus]CAK1670297.1 hypothetical protein AOBTE_LOCUS27539 [Acanthoscelides obtectus]